MNAPPAPLVHVILAEDDILAAMAIEDVLTRAGFRVTVAHNGQEALDADALDQADVLLTDLRMPVMDGMTLIRRLRDGRPNLPVVVTVFPPEGGLTKIQDNSPGDTVMLIKPASIKDLVEAIQRVTGQV